MNEHALAVATMFWGSLSSGCEWRRPPDMEVSCEYIRINTILSGPLVITHVVSSGCGWRSQPPDVEGSYECFE